MPSRQPATLALLDDQLLRAIASRGGARSYAANTVLVTEDDRSDALFIILAGRVKAYGSSEDGREIVYGTHSAGEYFGEMTLDGGPRSASVMTLEPTSCAVVPGAEVRQFLAEQPDFALHLIQKLIALARNSTELVKSLALDDVYGRVTELLQALAQDEEGVLMVPDRMTQQDIGERVGSLREMVSRVFKPLTEGGYIAMRSGCIAILKKLPARWSRRAVTLLPQALLDQLARLAAELSHPAQLLALASAGVAALLIIVTAFVRTMIPLRWLAVLAMSVSSYTAWPTRRR